MKDKSLSNLIEVISDHNICSGINSEQANEQSFVIQYQKLLISVRIPLFHFIKSLSIVKFHECF